MSVTRASVSEVVEIGPHDKGVVYPGSGVGGAVQILKRGPGLDSGTLKKKLWDDYRIRPVIDNREL